LEASNWGCFDFPPESQVAQRRLSREHSICEIRPQFDGLLSALGVGMAGQSHSSFRDLDVWRLSMDLVDAVIRETKKMARDEFDLRRQMRRAAVSIPANVAEGYRRKKKRAAYQNHISIAYGSQGELETEIEIAKRNSFMTDDSCNVLLDLCDRVGAMLYRLHESLET
jgi:four helix bundle protein